LAKAGAPVPEKKDEKDSLWSTLGEYFQVLEKKGVSTNFASFVGATSVRNYVLGFEDKKPSNPQELEPDERFGKCGYGSKELWGWVRL
jgi:N-acyl-D-aspartate/D-glutamate deacylase